MISLPFLAFKLFFKRPKLFALGVFPGVFTFAASSALVYAFWSFFLQGQALWISLPAMMAALLLSWLVVGNIALLPVEDILLDECQKALWNEVRLPAPPFQLSRLGREAILSLGLGISALLILAISIVPFMAPVGFVLTAWLTAYGFLSPIFSRKIDTISGRITHFFENPLSNLALGIMLNILLFLPVLNVFLLGYAQVLAALLYFRREPS